MAKTKKVKTTYGGAGGYLVGRKHSNGGIKVKNKSTGENLEVEGGEGVITAPAMDDPRPIHELDGVKGLTKKQVVSTINVEGGGVSFAEEGMAIPKKIRCTGKKYKFGGKMMADYEIVKSCGCKHTKMAQGGSTGKSEKSDNFTSKGISYEAQYVLSGEGQNSNETIIHTVANHLRTSKTASAQGQNKNLWRQQERSILLKYIEDNALWVDNIWEKNYISEGAEQKVYLFDKEHVVKFNDGIFYSSWLDYFNSLLLHNHYFPDTAYHLIGFIKKDETVFAVVKQHFVEETELTDPKEVKNFLADNGFENKKGNDYYNRGKGLILEDLHIGNILTKKGILYFIDTIFFITDEDGNVTSYEKGGEIHAKTHSQLITDIAALQLPASYQGYQGRPEDLLHFIQEQVTGMDTLRTAVHTYQSNYDQVVKTFGKDITLRSVEAIPQSEKDKIIKAWKGKALDPELRKALRSKTMEEGGMIARNGYDISPIVNDVEHKLTLPGTRYIRAVNSEEDFVKIRVSDHRANAANVKAEEQIVSFISNNDRRSQNHPISSEFIISENSDESIFDILRDYDLIAYYDNNNNKVNLRRKSMESGGIIQNNELLTKLESDMEHVDQQILQQKKKLEEAMLFALIGARDIISNYYCRKPAIKSLLAMIAGYEKDITDYHVVLSGIAAEHSDNAEKLAQEINKHKHSFFSRNYSYFPDEYENADDGKLCESARKYADVVKTISGKEAELWGSIMGLNALLINELETFIRVCEELKSVKQNVLEKLGFTVDDLNVTGSNYEEISQRIKDKIASLERERIELEHRAEVLEETGIELGVVVPEGTEERLEQFN